METYRVQFHGRTRGALGITYPITLTLQVEDGTSIDAVKLRVYDTHEQCAAMVVTRVDGPEIP